MPISLGLANSTTDVTMASIFSRLGSLFSGGGSEGATEEVVRELDGVRVIATPIKEGGTYRVAGRIEKDVDGKLLVRRFIRADVVNDPTEATEFTLRKGQQIVEQNGPSLFSDGVEERNA